MEKILIGLDGEFSGYYKPDEHYMISLGAWAIRAAWDPVSKRITKLTNAGVTDADGNDTSGFRASMRQPTPAHGFENACWSSFWSKPENLKLLEFFYAESKSPAEGMVSFVNWVHAMRGRSDVIFVVDCTVDSQWINHYLATHAAHRPLDCFFNDIGFTSQPYVADDAYRGMLALFDPWGLDSKIDGMFKLTGIPKGTHDPKEDAKEIVWRYASAMATYAGGIPAAMEQ